MRKAFKVESIKIAKRITKQNIWRQALKGNPKVLKSKYLLIGREINKVTPLHYLAHSGLKEVLDHPLVSNLRDKAGWTPLHWYASTNDFPLKYLEKKYPWYSFPKEYEANIEMIHKILETPNSVRFIKEKL